LQEIELVAILTYLKDFSETTSLTSQSLQSFITSLKPAQQSDTQLRGLYLVSLIFKHSMYDALLITSYSTHDLILKHLLDTQLPLAFLFESAYFLLVLSTLNSSVVPLTMIPTQTVILEWIDTLTEVSFIHQTSHLAMHTE
jgi:hypothetical protein